MKKILLYLPVMLILAAGFGCSEQRKWNREQRKEMREMLRDYRQMAYLNDLTDAEFILFSDDVATALEGDYPVYATFVTMPGVEDTVQLVIVETVVEELQADARNMRHIFPYEQLVARKMLPAGLDHDQLHAFYNCLAGKVERMGADAVEVSLSAPLGTRMDVGTVPREIFGFISAVTEAVDIPVSVKLSYEASNFNGFTSSLEEAGVAGVTAIEALKGLMGVDLEHHRALMPTYGGYSGQYIRPIALATIATLKQTTGFPICGCGGINSAHDALEFIMLGAQSVQLASVLLRDSYEAIPRILGDLERWLEDHGYYSIEEVCGLALGSLHAFEELPPRPLTAHLTGGCDGCGKCVSSCLYGAMTIEAGKIVLDAARCTGCGMCEAICPENALELRW